MGKLTRSRSDPDREVSTSTLAVGWGMVKKAELSAETCGDISCVVSHPDYAMKVLKEVASGQEKALL